MVRDQNTNSDKWGYEPSLVDLRFLKAVDYIIEKNKTANIKPDTDNSISKTIYGQGKTIKEIRCFERGVAMTELHKFADYFHLDFNYFFRGTGPILYNPKSTTNKWGNIIGEDIDIVGNMESSNLYKGDVYNGGIHIHKGGETIL